VRPYYQRNLRCTGATVDKYFPCEPAAVAVAVRSNSTKHDPRKGTSACMSRTTRLTSRSASKFASRVQEVWGAHENSVSRLDVLGVSNILMY
jgi:hypothetical protein